MNRQAYECEKMDHICKTVTRSDGTMKIYSINTQGKLLTVVMAMLEGTCVSTVYGADGAKIEKYEA